LPGVACKRCNYFLNKVKTGKRLNREEFQHQATGTFKYRCDVGLKSLLRSIVDYYKLAILSFQNTNTYSHDSDSNWVGTVSAFVEQKLSSPDMPAPEDVIVCLLALLESTTRLAINTPASKSSTTMQRKMFPEASINLPGLRARKKLASQLIYNMNKKYLRLFMYDAGNSFLIEHFARKDGLSKTDSSNSKPACRYTELRNLVLIGR
jgi:hypothetical protein